MSHNKIKLIYIAGLGRNGGTLLDRILGQIGGFFSLGEFMLVWQKGILGNELCNCGVPFTNCTFWSAVYQEAFGGFGRIDASRINDLRLYTDRTRYLPLLMSPWKPKGYRKRLEHYVDILEQLYRAIANVSNCRVLVNSSKFAGHALALNELSNVDLYVLQLVRDSRAAAFSWKKKKKKPEVVGRAAYIRQYSAAASAIQWSHRNFSAGLLKHFAKKYLFLRYEDFVANPREAVKHIVEWVGEEVENLPFVDDFTVCLGNSHTQSGNPMRFQQGQVRIRLDDEWVKEICKLDKILVTSLTWPLLIKYGY